MFDRILVTVSSADVVTVLVPHRLAGEVVVDHRAGQRANVVHEAAMTAPERAAFALARYDREYGASHPLSKITQIAIVRLLVEAITGERPGLREAKEVVENAMSLFPPREGPEDGADKAAPETSAATPQAKLPF